MLCQYSTHSPYMPLQCHTSFRQNFNNGVSVYFVMVAIVIRLLAVSSRGLVDLGQAVLV